MEQLSLLSPIKAVVKPVNVKQRKNTLSQNNIAYKISVLLLILFFPNLSWASSLSLQAVHSFSGWLALMVFFAAYGLVMCEELTQLKKSKPVVLAAGIIWLLVAIAGMQKGLSDVVNLALRQYVVDYAELLLFLVVAMTYINAMTERQVFAALRIWLINQGLSYRRLFWITGILAFFLSPIADNLTTALIMGAVVAAVGAGNVRFISLGCINVVVAANAGGAFSPFGDITTLMVWQSGIVPFASFFKLFFPALISFLIPALFMHWAIPKEKPLSTEYLDPVQLRPGALLTIALFLLTVLTTVIFQHYFALPPALGMMTGLGYLQFFAYFSKKRFQRSSVNRQAAIGKEFDFFRKIQDLEWDTLLLFYGIILGVGGLATLGYLEIAANFLYHQLGATLPVAQQATPANILVGILSALIGNIPVLFGVLSMNPQMSQGQWLLVTLTTGIGGNLLSLGSAAGIGLMGQAQGAYTFIRHLRWVWAIALGYLAAILCHLWINSHLF